MNLKKRSLLVASLAAILSLSLVSLSDIPQATADRDDDSGKPHFHKKPHFVSERCLIMPYAEAELPEEALAELDCKMTAWLDKKGTALKYKIKVLGMEFVDTNTDPDHPEGLYDNIDGIHIHKISPAKTTSLDNPKGPHQLNVFANPGFDDSQVVVKPVQGIVKGIWDDGDQNLSYGEPDNSHTLTENLGLLCEGKIFSAVHGEIEDRPHHKAPYVKMLLEPTKSGEKICKKILDHHENDDDDD